MLRFLIRVGSFGAIQLAVLAIVVSSGSPRDSNHYLSSIHDKRKMLADASRPRLILVGGSNVAFGFSSELFEEKLACQPINLGLHAGLGLDFPLRLVEEAVRPGDLIIVAPEYSLLTTEAYEGDSTTITQLIEQWPAAKQYFESAPSSKIKQLLDRDGLWLAHLWVRNTRRRLTGADSADPIYRRSNFNRYGDMVGHHGVTTDSLTHRAVLSVAQPWGKRAVRRLNDFQAICNNNGGRVLFCYPPIPRKLYSESRQTIREIEELLATSLEIPVAHTPEEVAYRREWFFDTAYHLTETGADERSALLLSRIRQDRWNVARQPSSAKADALTR